MLFQEVSCLSAVTKDTVHISQVPLPMNWQIGSVLGTSWEEMVVERRKKLMDFSCVEFNTTSSSSCYFSEPWFLTRCMASSFCVSSPRDVSSFLLLTLSHSTSVLHYLSNESCYNYLYRKIYCEMAVSPLPPHARSDTRGGSSGL